MAKGIQDIANNLGYVYMTALDGTTIISTQPNSPSGVRNMRDLGTVVSPFAAKRAAYGILQVTTAAATGNVTAVNVNGVNQIGANIPIVSASNSAAAILIAAAINAFTPASGPDCVASAQGDFVYIFTPASFGAASNGYAVSYSATGGALVATTTAFAYGSSEGGVYDSVIGRRFFLNADYDANGVSGGSPAIPTSLTNSVEITEYMVMRGFQTGVGTIEATISTDAINSVERFCAITQLTTTNQGGAATDSLEYINATKFVDGDLLLIKSTSTAQALTVKDAANASVTPSPNIYLTDQNNFILQNNKAILLRYTFDAVLGGIFVEVSRSVTGTGIVSLTRAALLTLVTSSAIEIGQTYFVTDVGVGGILLTGTKTNAVSLSGQYLAINPDYNNVSGDYGGTWYATMGVPTINKLYAFNGKMYSSVTGAVGTDPDSDATNWTLVSFNDSRYVREIDFILYDLGNNHISCRKDRRNNVVNQSFENFTSSGVNAMDYFQWGNNTCTDNNVDGSVAYLANQAGTCINNSFTNNTSWANTIPTGGFLQNNVFIKTSSIGDEYNTVENNFLVNCATSSNTGAAFSSNNMQDSIISTNTTSDITNNQGYVNIQGNTDCTIDTNSGSKNWIGLTVNNLITLNQNCNISGNSFEMGTIISNIGMAATFNKLLNGYIQNCENNNYPALPASSCVVSQLQIMNEGKVDNVHWNTAGSIIRGRLNGNYGQVVNILFDSSITIPAVTGVQTSFDTFDIDGVTVDGNNTALSFQSNSLASFGANYGFVSINNNSSAAWGFLNMATAFSAGTLTIPIELSHAGVIYLYGCNGQNVTSIVVNSNIKNLKKFPVSFRWVQGAGTVTFTPTALPLAGNQFGSDSAAEVLTAVGDSYTVEKISNNYFKKYSSINL